MYVSVQQPGNESHTGHHTNGRLQSSEDTENIDIRVPENAYGFAVTIWNNSADRFSVSVKSPTGEVISRVPAKAGTIFKTNLILEKSNINVLYFFPVKGSGSQLTVVRILEPTPGIWTITLHGDIVLDGRYNAWLPITGFITEGVEFLTPSPDYTVVVPATSSGSITCGAYDDMTDSLYIQSSWGPTRAPSIGIDLAAPRSECFRNISKKQRYNDRNKCICEYYCRRMCIITTMGNYRRQ